MAKPLRDFIVEASSNLEHSSLIPFFLGYLYSSRISLRGRSAASLRQNCVTVFSFSKNHFSSPSGRWSLVLLTSSWGSTLQPYGRQHTYHHYRTQRPAYEKTESLPRA